MRSKPQLSDFIPPEHRAAARVLIVQYVHEGIERGLARGLRLKTIRLDWQGSVGEAERIVPQMAEPITHGVADV